MRNILLVALVTLLGSSCKPKFETNLINALPVRVATAETSGMPMVDWGTVRLDAKGAPKAVLILSRDFIPQTASNKDDRQPKCLAPLQDSFGAIARGVCINDAGLSVEIKPSQIRQECYTHPTDKPMPASSPLLLPGCSEMKIEGYHFDPELRIDIEPTDSPFVK